MSLFQSEAEQIQKIDAAAENAAKEAESEKPSAFVISEDEIDRMLRTGSNFEGGKIRIYALYQQQGDAKERAAFLKAEYGLGGHSYTFMDGSRGFADYNGRGILLRNYDHDREVRLTWSAVDKRLDRLVENDQYLTALEMEEYRKLEQEYGAPLPMPTAAHVFPPTPPERYDTGNEHVDNMLNTAADVYARSELAAPQRFTVMETDDGYAVWDDIQDGIHVEPDGVSEEFTSEWEAETYRQQLIEKVQEREAKDWLYVEQSKQNLQQDIPFPDVESEEVQEYLTYICDTVLRDTLGVISKDAVDTSDPTYLAWAEEESISLREYLNYAAGQNWIDISVISPKGEYLDSAEIYQAMTSYIVDYLKTDLGFSKLLYKYLLMNDQISGQDLCLVLYEQGVLSKEDEAYSRLASGELNSYDFMINKIANLEIEPAQLALKPCSASAVVTDVNTGK